MTGVQAIRSDWWQSLKELVSSARTQLTIVAPFISADGSRAVGELISSELSNTGCIHVLTDLSPTHVQSGGLQPEAVLHLLGRSRVASLWHVPCLHAKVYVADRCRAIVTSGNLTCSAFHRNVEIGLDIIDPHLVQAIEDELTELRVVGVPVGIRQLQSYSRVAAEVRKAFELQQAGIEPRLQKSFTEAVQTAQDELIRLRLAGGAMHTVFAKTILFLLRTRGPLATATIHRLVRALHPDLCDDTVDRVIDGKSFGKKWKHAVRSAQQHLKGRGLIEIDQRTGSWRVI